jgi:hypothetical protein
MINMHNLKFLIYNAKSKHLNTLSKITEITTKNNSNNSTKKLTTISQPLNNN